MSISKIPEIVSKVSVADSENEAQPEETAASALAALGNATMFTSGRSSMSETDEQKSSDDDEDHDDGKKGTFEIPQRYTKSGRKRAVPFPIKLMKVLSTKQFNDIISWMPSGKSFSIIQPKAFVSDILPEHFKSAKYSSFTRKLHRWGFMRHYRGEEAGAFYHQDFQKDRLDLVEQMTCYTKHETTPAPKKKVASPSNESFFASSGLTTPPQLPRMLPTSSHVATQQAPMPQSRELIARLRQQQQNLVNLEIAVPPLDAAERLHAAIELEVTRRLKERLQAAAMSQAMTPMRPTMYDHDLLLRMQQHKQQHFHNNNPSCFGGFSRMANEGLEQLPHKTIAGARTA